MLYIRIIPSLSVLLLVSAESIPSNAVHRNVSKSSELKAGSEGYIIVAGGNNGKSDITSCFTFDVYSGTWSSLPDLPSARHGGGLVAHQGNVYYAAGGTTDVLQLITRKSKWMKGPSLETIGGTGIRALSINNTLYVLGGYTDKLEQISTCGTGSLVWKVVATTPEEHSSCGAAVLNGLIYICGTYWKHPSKNCETYDPATNQFHIMTPMLQPRTSLSMLALNGYLYVIGGADAYNERYDPVKDEWTYFSNVPSQMYSQAAVVVGQNIYVIGGTDPVNAVNMYVPEFDIWQPKNSYPIQIYEASATFVKSLP